MAEFPSIAPQIVQVIQFMGHTFEHNIPHSQMHLHEPIINIKIASPFSCNFHAI